MELAVGGVLALGVWVLLLAVLSKKRGMSTPPTPPEAVSAVAEAPRPLRPTPPEPLFPDLAAGRPAEAAPAADVRSLPEWQEMTMKLQTLEGTLEDVRRRLEASEASLDGLMRAVQDRAALPAIEGTSDDVLALKRQIEECAAIIRSAGLT